MRMGENGGDVLAAPIHSALGAKQNKTRNPKTLPSHVRSRDISIFLSSKFLPTTFPNHCLIP